ncbi:hypothetical protein [Kocuria himachalensis]
MTAEPTTKTCLRSHTGQLMAAPETPGVFRGTGLGENNWHDSDESVRTDLLTTGPPPHPTPVHLRHDSGHNSTEHTTG